MKLLNMKQGSTEWSLVRAGCVTASEADSLFTPKMEPRTGEGVKTYLYKKACERIMGPPVEGPGSFHMDQGNVLEKLARPWYSFRFGVDIQQVGFCLSDDGKTGCSPDGLIGELCGLEIKCPTPPMHCRYLLENRVPPDYVAQVHFSMFVTGRPEWVFCSYSPYLPQLVIHVVQTQAATDAIGRMLATVTAQIDEYENRIRAMMPKEQGRD